MNFTEEVGDALYDALVASINRSDSAQEQNGKCICSIKFECWVFIILFYFCCC